MFKSKKTGIAGIAIAILQLVIIGVATVKVVGLAQDYIGDTKK
jgi:hypothetical protein